MTAPEAVTDEAGGIAAETSHSTSIVAAVPHRLDLVGVLLVAFGAVAFSGKAIIVKLGFRLGADAITLLALRMAVALPFFLLIGVWAARRAPALARGDRWRIVALGVCGYYLASLLDFLGLAYISATLERVILYLTPTFVLLLGALLAHRRPTRRQLVALAISYAGVLLAFGHDLGIAGGDVVRGGLLVLGSAVSYAVYLYGSGEIVARVGAVRLTAYASTVASVLCIGQYLLLEPSGLPTLPGAVYGLSLLNGTVCTVLPVLATMVGVRRIGSGPASQIGMIGPVSTIVLSLLILHEPMGSWQIAGTLLVVAGVLSMSRSKI
jgi:drug/metabolite transporter (DMT)-like permease